MTRWTIRLIERRARVVRLPAADARYLTRHFPTILDVTPGFDRGTFRLTPRGYVGFLATPARRIVIEPKVPWPAVLVLLGLEDVSPQAGTPADPEVGLFAILATELAARLTALTRTGLVAGYREEDSDSSFLRGRLRTADRMRAAARRSTPARFPVTADAFDLDTPWNRVPKAVGVALLASPELSPSVRAALAAGLVPFESVPAVRPTEEEFAAADREPRASAYRPVLDLCRLLHSGLKEADHGAGGGAFLVDLGRAFEVYLSRGLVPRIDGRPGWSADIQPRLPLGEAALFQPDLLVRRRGEPWAVLDAKWKTPRPEPADLHQVLAYAALSGARRAALVYPGRRFARRELVTTPGGVRLTHFRIDVCGPPDSRAASLERLVRTVLGWR